MHTKRFENKNPPSPAGFRLIARLRATPVATGLFFGRLAEPPTHERKGDTKMLTEYSPHATAYAARCKPDTLRDWRRLGFFKGLGERKGKGHLFTLSDVARIVVAAFIARNGASLREAFEIVGERGRTIDAVAAAE